jgi:transposase InsO family protein
MLKISRQAVYQRRHRQASDKAHEQDLRSRVHALRELMPRVGGRKLFEHIPTMVIGRDKFFDFLRENALLVRRRRTYTPTTNSRHDLPVYPNLLSEVIAEAPNTIWVADQTYIRLRRGFCYLSLITDRYSRKIVGYDVAPTLEATGPLKALRMAFDRVQSPQGLIHHSDRGSQYCSHMYTKELLERGCLISMSEPRRPDQNAVAERVNGILKSEFYLDTTFESIAEAHRAISQTIYIYNNIRLHLSLNMNTPSKRHAA